MILINVLSEACAVWSGKTERKENVTRVLLNTFLLKVERTARVVR